MFKLLIVVLSLIVLALVLGARLHFDPSWPILGILAFGLFMMGVVGDPTMHPNMPRSGKHPHWGSGNGIYFDPDDVWVIGSDSEDFGGSNDDDGSRR
jgi:hypothetical protein